MRGALSDLEELYGAGSVISVFEIGCTPHSKKLQVKYNKNTFIKSLSWTGYEPAQVFTGICHWNGSGSEDSEIDVWVKHKDVPVEMFDSLDKLILSLGTPRECNMYDYFKERDHEGDISSEDILDLITQEGLNQKYGNLRGLLSEIISIKTIEKNLADYGTFDEITVVAPTIIRNRKTAYELDPPRQIDLVVSCPDHEEFSKFLNNLKRDKSVEVKTNSKSAGLY